MKHELLDNHARIAWDMDYTLKGGPNSSFFRNFINANPGIEHHIVTFRTGASRIINLTDPDWLNRTWADDCIVELKELGVDVALITSVQSVPDELYHAYVQRRTFPQPEKVALYLRWKGWTAAQLGCTVLVDDMMAHVILGCQENGVQFIDSFDPSFGHPDYQFDLAERYLEEV